MTADMVDRVAAGAALLDEYDEGWHLTIDLNELVLSDCRRCVLGQLFGLYHEGVAHFEAVDGWAWALDHGFDDNEDDWEALRLTWVDEIRRRRAAEDWPTTIPADPFLDTSRPPFDEDTPPAVRRLIAAGLTGGGAS